MRIQTNTKKLIIPFVFLIPPNYYEKNVKTYIKYWPDLEGKQSCFCLQTLRVFFSKAQIRYISMYILYIWPPSCNWNWANGKGNLCHCKPFFLFWLNVTVKCKPKEYIFCKLYATLKWDCWSKYVNMALEHSMIIAHRGKGHSGLSIYTHSLFT